MLEGAVYHVKRAFRLTLVVIPLLWITCVCVELPKARKGEALFSARVDLGQLSKAIKAYRDEYGNLPNIGTEGRIETESDYRRLLLTLMGEDLTENPRGKKFLRLYNTPRRRNATPPFTDPWGNFYRVRFDSDGDGFVESPLGEGRQSVALIWTLGPDGKLDLFDPRTWTTER
jgi:hypothetical protein